MGDERPGPGATDEPAGVAQRQRGISRILESATGEEIASLLGTNLQESNAGSARTPAASGLLTVSGNERTIIDGHGIDHAKTRSGKGSCQPGYAGKPFTCLCGIGPMTLPELYDHMTGGRLEVGGQQWMDQADVAALNSAVSDDQKREAADRLSRRERRARGAAA